MTKSWDIERSKLTIGKVYWSHRDFIFRNSEKGYTCFLSTDNISKFTEGTMARSNFSEPTFEELQWFEYCEQQQQYISFTDYQSLIVPTLNSIQLYPLN